MFILSLLTMLSCPKTVLENTSGIPWNDYDRSILNQVKTRCKQIYPDAPCVKLFRKFNEQSYTVLCGIKE